MKLYFISDTNEDGDNFDLFTIANTPEEACQQWLAYYEIEPNGHGGPLPERIFEINLLLPNCAAEPFPLGWHNDHVKQVGGWQ